jgi:hypothetical protein
VELPLILDRYRPLGELGRGGHGSVVLAFDTKMARRVAIKRLPLPLDRAGRPLAKAGLAEARTGALLNHPSIVTVHEWDTDSDEAFIVMEAIDGVSLAQLLDSTGTPLNLDEAAALVEAVGAALEFAHGNGVLHLDLKPANVLITRDGRVKVADFGVSALTDLHGLARGASGTIGYMPPEQVRGEPLGPLADEWAFASLLYEALTCANPFDAETAEGSLFRIEVADVPAPTDFEPDLPAGVDLVLLAALAPAPAERYPSVADFALTLSDHLGDAVPGRASLAEVVASLVEDEEGRGAAEPLAPLGLWDRLARFSGAARRVWAALACAWLLWAGLAAFDLGAAPAAVGAALGGLAAALAPGLGLALGALAFAAGVGSRMGPGAAALVLLPAAAFWALRGRYGRGDAFAPLAAPLFAVGRGALATPLILGFVFEPLPAALAAAAAAASTMALSVVSGAAAPFLRVPWRLLFNPWTTLADAPGALALVAPGPVIALAGWALAAAISSLACRRATRVAAAAGALTAGVVLAAAYAVWATLEPAALGPEMFLPDITVALMLTIVVIALGPPTRPEEPADGDTQ